MKSRRWKVSVWYIVLGAVILIVAGVLFAWNRSGSTFSIEDSYAAEVAVPSAFTPAGSASFPSRKPPAAVWYYTSTDTPGNIIQSLRAALTGKGFAVTLSNGQLTASNKDLDLSSAISRSSEAHTYTIAITATEAHQ